MTPTWARRARRAGIALIAVGATLGSGTLGWALRDWTADELGDVIVKRPVRVFHPDAPAAGAMPNVVGLDEQSARQALSDAGVDVRRVESRRRPYVGEPGIVVGQSPAATTKLPAGDVVLELSEPAKMPDLAGKPAAEARAALERIGVTVAAARRYEAGVPEGTVLATHPGAGEEAPGDAELVLADAPSRVFLGQLEPVDSDCAAETVNVDGERREDALVCDPGGGSARMEYVLNRRVSVLRATVGLADRSASDARVSFRVVVDGREAAAETVGLGTVESVIVPVEGALRVRLEAERVAGGQDARAVWADAALQGGREAIDALVAESSG